MPHNLQIGSRVIIAWRHWNDSEGARMAVVSKVTGAGYVYAGYAGEKFCGDEFPLTQTKSRRLEPGDYHRTIIADTAENRALFGMPERARVGLVYKKPRAGHAATTVNAADLRLLEWTAFMKMDHRQYLEIADCYAKAPPMIVGEFRYWPMEFE